MLCPAKGREGDILPTSLVGGDFLSLPLAVHPLASSSQ